ncbi:MAG: nucleotidyltransferase domain-containing protein [Nanoarchaeota archaeon]|nr:nucleotidyltransferase domain-containing protein [Nanoarchaeota archaeon]
MINRILPLTENKLRILKEIYEKKEIYLLEISRSLKIHPFSVQKTLKSIKSLLEEKKRGKTFVLSINKRLNDYLEIICFIEYFKLETKNRDLIILIKNLQEFFSSDKNVLSCILFGSYARESHSEKSDIDILFVVKSKDKEILNKCRNFSSLLSKEVNPIILNEKEFLIALKTKEPMIATILEPSQRLLIIGKEYFLKNTLWMNN